MNLIPFDQLDQHVDTQVATSDWLEIDQSRIDAFAEATGDHQWIHVDPARAAQGPFGTTIAHGYLTLSLIPHLLSTAFEVSGVRRRVNYGLDKVRFPAPVRVGSSVRARATLTGLDRVPGGQDMALTITIDMRDGSKPACVARTRTRLFA